jgi:hypothetical protein
MLFILFTDTPYLIDQLMNSYDEVVSSYSTTDQHPSVQWFYNSFGKDIGSSTTTTSTAATDGDNSSQPITVHDNTAASNTTSAGTAAASSFFLPGNEGATTTASTINMADIATVIEDKCRGSKKRKQTIKPLKVSKKKKQKRDEIQFSRESATTTSSSSSNPGIIASIGGNVMQVETSVAKASNMSPIFPSQIASSTQHFPVYHLQNDDLQNTAETTTKTTTMTSTIAAAVDTDFVPPSFSSSSSSSPSSVYSISEIVAKIEAAIGGEEATVGDRAVVVSSGDITTSNNDDDNNNNNRLRLESLNEHLITLCQWKTMIKNQNPILPDIHIVRTIDGEYSFDLYLCYDDPNRVMYLAQPIALRSRKSKLKLAIRVITGLMTSELLYSITILRRPCSLMELKSAFLKLTADEPSNQHMLCLQRNVPYPYKIL